MREAFLQANNANTLKGTEEKNRSAAEIDVDEVTSEFI